MSTQVDKGFLFVFEGPEFSGKSTQLKLVEDALVNLGYLVTRTFTPGGTSLGMAIRKIVKHPEYQDSMDDLTKLLLFSAGRRNVICDVIYPAMDKKHIVLCDRFTMSTIVYQGYAEGLDMKHISIINNMIEGSSMVDYYFVFDIPVSEIEKRKVQSGRTELDGYDKKPSSFHERIRSGYTAQWEKDPLHVGKIDGMLPKEQITGQIVSTILDIIIPSVGLK